MNVAGLEKCTPRKRPLCSRPAARSPIGSVEVLLPITASGRAAASTLQNWTLHLGPLQYRLLDQIYAVDSLGEGICSPQILSHKMS
jgi:hypothetical protein